MPRDRWVRMDVDTQWAYHRKVRDLQSRFPDDWPSYMAAFFVLLGEAWTRRSREVTLIESWCPAVPISSNQARLALISSGLLDRYGRVPKDSWDDWYGPAARKRESARNAAAVRWHSEGNASAMPRHNQTDITRQTRARANGPVEEETTKTKEQYAEEVAQRIAERLGVEP